MGPIRKGSLSYPVHLKTGIEPVNSDSGQSPKQLFQAKLAVVSGLKM